MSVASHPLDPNSHDLDAASAPEAAAIEVAPSSTGLWLLLLLLGATFLGWYYYGKRPPAPPPAPAMPLVIVPPIERNTVAEAAPAATARKTAVAAAAAEAAVKPATEAAAKIDTPRATQALPLAADNAAPRYPAGARRRGEGGTVVLRVNVGADGKPEDVEVARHSGSRELDRAALVAVRDWRFRPATRDGREVASVVEQPVEFKPRQ